MKTTVKGCGRILPSIVAFGAILLSMLSTEVLAQTGCASPSPTLVSWWQGEYGTTDMMGWNPGTAVGNLTFGGGELGQAFVLDGFSGLEVPDSPSLNPAGSLSIEGWVYPTVDQNGVIMAKWGGTGDYNDQRSYIFKLVTGLGLNFAVTDAANQWNVPFQAWVVPNVITLNTWSHVAAVYDQTTGTRIMYVNGQEVGRQTDPPITVLHSIAKVGIGGYFLSSTTFDQGFYGLLDEIAFYADALPAAAILAIYNAGVSGKCTTPTQPSILAQPQDQSAGTGDNVLFKVVAYGSAPLTYQWSFNNLPLADATNALLTLKYVTANEGGGYSVLVSNPYGTATSSNAILTVEPPVAPYIATNPTSQTVFAGSTASFIVAAGGSAPLRYQWRFNSADLADATNATLLLANLDASQAGVYAALVSSPYGTALSSNANLTLQTVATNLFDDFDPQIDAAQWSGFGGTVLATNYGGFVSSPYSLWFGGSGSRYAVTRPVNAILGGQVKFYLCMGDGSSLYWSRPSAGRDVVVEYSSNGGGSWTQMARYGAAMNLVWAQYTLTLPAGARITNLLLRWRQLINGGTYYDHWAVDDVLISTVPVPPALAKQPSSQTVVVGGSAKFTPTVSGSLPLSYQWRFNETAIPGATNSSLSLTNLQLSQAGNYSVVVTNLGGSATSSNALLTVSFPADSVLVSSTNVAAAGTLSVSILLAATGSENTLGLSLNFNPALLTYTGVAPGEDASGAFFQPNTSQAASGRLGLMVSYLDGTTFAPGRREIARVTFAVAPIITNACAAINFGDAPIAGQLLDAAGNAISANFIGGIASIIVVGFEGDVSPRPDGNGSLGVNDWTLMGRYAARLDYPTNGSEFARADCAPRASGGDGAIRVTDWVQVGRYAFGYDTLIASGGPSAEVPNSAGAGPSTMRLLTVGQTTLTPAQPTTANVMLSAQGGENALGFSLAFNPALASFTSATLGSNAAGGTLYVNPSQSTAGRLGFALALPVGSSFAAGNKEVLKVSFVAAPASAGAFAPFFTDQPVPREISDDGANALPVSYVSGAAANAPGLRISRSEGAVMLGWPLWAAGFVLEHADGSLAPATTWSNLTVTVNTNSHESTVVLPASGVGNFYRLRQP